jgi:hypothetical protein
MKMTRSILGVLLLSMLLGNCLQTEKQFKMIQITNGSFNHDLDNNDNFSPDGKWLVYDTRTAAGGIGGSPSIERVNVETGVIEELIVIKNNRKPSV